MRNEILAEIRQERARQDEQWGGPEHDDQHSIADWRRFISKQNQSCHDHMHRQAFRVRMVKLAALAVAAIESTGRFDAGLPREGE